MKNLISLLFIASLIVAGYTVYRLTRHHIFKMEADKSLVYTPNAITVHANGCFESIDDSLQYIELIKHLDIIVAKRDTIIYHHYDGNKIYLISGSLTMTHLDSLTLYKGSIIAFIKYKEVIGDTDPSDSMHHPLNYKIRYTDLSKGVKASHVYVDNPTNNVVWTEPTKTN